jgi:hypothetical protein
MDEFTFARISPTRSGTPRQAVDVEAVKTAIRL